MSESGMQGDDRSIKIERDAISSAIVSGNGNRVVIYQYQLERQIEPEPTNQPGEIGFNPYKGLLAFQEEDGDRYFGREEQIKKLWNQFRKLHEDTTQLEPPLRLLPILGPSGCGKSSLARAGLIPELARHPLPGQSQARVAVLVPGTHPVETLATVLARVATNDQTPVAKTREFKQELELKETSDTNTDTIIYDGLLRIANVLPEIAVSSLVILVDQFEEVYSLCEDKKERQIFIENLIHAAGDRTGSVSVIITLRSDFLGETQRHPALNQAIASQGAIVPAMSEEELRRAITKPAELAGHPLDEAVVTLLLKDTQGREGALPLLQFALTRIWEGLKEGVEPVKTLEKIGGVGGALAAEAQRIFDNLNDKEKQIARRVFVGLVQLGEGASDTRRRASVTSLVSYRDEPEHVKRVIERFANPGVRLVTLSSEGGNETAEVSHEALFANWGQMREWLDGSRSDIRFQRRLDEAALHWDENGRPEGSLWRSPDLDFLKKYYQRTSENMTPLQVDFFNASQQAENVRNRNRKLSITGLIVGLLLTTTTAGVAGLQWKRAERLLRTSEIDRIAVTALNQFETGGAEIESLLLALQSGQKLQNEVKNNQVFQNYPTVRPLFVLQKILDNIKEQNRLDAHGDKVINVTFSPDGKQIASVGKDNTLRLWNLSGQQISNFEIGKAEKVNFTPDGRSVITFGDKGKIWNLSGQQIAQFDNKKNIIFSPDGQDISVVKDKNNNTSIWSISGQQLANLNLSSKIDSTDIEDIFFSPDGRYIAILEDRNTISLWNIFGQQVTKLITEYEINYLAISPDGQHIAFEENNSNVIILNLSGQKKAQFNSGIYTSRYIFSPNGEYIAGEGTDGKVRLWNLSGEQIAILDALDGSIMAPGSGRIELVSFSPNSQYIVTIGMSNQAILWNLSGQKLAVLNTKNSVLDVSFSPDSQNIITAGSNGKIGFWNLSSSNIAHFEEGFDGKRGLSRRVGFSPNGKYIVTQDYEDTILLWNQFGKQIAKFKIVLKSLQELSVTPDGKYIFGLDLGGGKLKLWNLEGEQINQWDAIDDMSVSPNGKYIAIKEQDTIQIWNLLGQKTSEFRVGSFDNLNFSPDGQYIYTNSLENRTLILWNLEGQPINQWNKIKASSFITEKEYIAIQKENYLVEVFDLSKKPITKVTSFNLGAEAVFSPDGKYIATNEQDKTQTWTWFGEKISQFHTGNDHRINFSPDGQQIVTAEGYRIRLWTTLGQQIAEFENSFRTRHSLVSNVSFSPNGQYIIIETGGYYINLLLRVEKLDELLDKGCNWARDYLKNNAPEEDRGWCDGIGSGK